MHAILILLSINQHRKSEVPSFTDSKDMDYGSPKNLKYGSRDPDHVNYGIIYHLKGSTLTYSTYIQNLVTLASAFRRYYSGHRN